MVAVSRPDGCCFALLCAVRTLAYKSQSIPAQPVVLAYAQVSALQGVSSMKRKWIRSVSVWDRDRNYRLINHYLIDLTTHLRINLSVVTFPEKLNLSMKYVYGTHYLILKYCLNKGPM